MKWIQKILIANRGEIACRIIRSCQDMGIATVAIHSDVDSNAKFVREADEAFCLSGNTSLESYLDVEKVLKAAKVTGADAVHPGYGFLAENADFARRVQDAGMIFIGPKAETIECMGSKIKAKDLMKEAKVPSIPGYQGKDQAVDQLMKHAKKIGFPCMIKASAGGGGKGLKKVNKESELKEAIESAAREGKNSFNDATLLIEKFIESPRHIEIQVFGDEHGNVIHLFERECSLQRRHQKVIEEAPSSILTPELREKIGKTAVKAAKAVGYVGAGTVEFILDPKGNFYFMEMNTRLQVEHPVTEMITGLDLVKMQIQVAQGEPLSVSQDDLSINGHAIEARLYAENPWQDFLPVSGKILHLELPAVSGMRYDMGVESHDEISVYYDPMIGKVIAHAEDRQTCLKKISYALERLAVLGTTTNSDFLIRLLKHPEHIAGNFDTSFIDANLTSLLDRNDESSIDRYLIAATLIDFLGQDKEAFYQQLAGFRNLPQTRTHSVFCGDDEHKILYEVIDAAKHQFKFEFKDSIDVTLNHLGKHEVILTLNGHRQRLCYTYNNGTLYFKQGGENLVFESLSKHQEAVHHGEQGGLTAPLPGKVLKILVKQGQKVAPGETLMIVEAMKMEHPIKADDDGEVQNIYFKENDLVKLGDVLLEVA
jgi:3-methylcrotonyl-CoA carboxylase alpha subunit